MDGDGKVMAGLQEAINLEWAGALQYGLDARDLMRLGLKTADGLMTLHEQCEMFAWDLIDRLLFLGGSPEIRPDNAAETHATVGDILNDALAFEMAVVGRYAELCKEAYEAGDMEAFHLYQHLTKWHRMGGNDNKGHIAWLQKQLAQYQKVGGEAQYIQIKA
jgi:bacterioferritin